MQTSSMMIKLIINYSPDAAELIAFPFGKITIGRKPNSSLVLNNEYISRTHAVIFIDWWGKLKIRDGAIFGKRSKHGLYLDDCRIWEEELCEDDVIKFSQFFDYPNIEIMEIAKTNGEIETQNFAA